MHVEHVAKEGNPLSNQGQTKGQFAKRVVLNACALTCRFPSLNPNPLCRASRSQNSSRIVAFACFSTPRKNIFMVGSSQPVVSHLAVCKFYAEALFCAFCALLRSVADLRLRSFALIRAPLRAFCGVSAIARRCLGTPDTGVSRRIFQRETAHEGTKTAPFKEGKRPIKANGQFFKHPRHGGKHCHKANFTLPTKIYAGNCKLFWEYLRCAVTIISSETIIFFMQLHLPYFSGTPSNAFAAFKIIGIY